MSILKSIYDRKFPNERRDLLDVSLKLEKKQYNIYYDGKTAEHIYIYLN